MTTTPSSSTTRSDTPDVREHRAGPTGPPASVAARFSAVVQRGVADRLPLTGALAVLMVGMGLLTGSLWPSLEGTLSDLPDNLTDTLGKALSGADMTTAIGWTNAEFVSLVAPLGVIAAAIIAVTRGVVGEEAGKTLGVLLSVPLARTTFLLAKAAAMAVHVLLVAGSISVGLLMGSLVGDMGLSASGILAVALHAAALGLFFGGVALLVGALTGDARLTLVVTASIAGAAFIATAILPLFESAADWARVSPWYYFNSSDPLSNGADWLHLVVLVVGAGLLAALAVTTYRGRDLRG